MELYKYNEKPYDESDPKSIERYAQKLIGHTFNDIISWKLPHAVHEENMEDLYEARTKADKGVLGKIIEQNFFGYKANSNPMPDFPKAGVELKVSPYEIKKNGKLSVGERLVLSMITYNQAVEPDFMSSHIWAKCKLMLLIYYLRNKALENNLDFHVDYAKLFSPPKEDLKIIIQDYKTIIDKIASGKANELSEADTLYLGACTKGASAEKSTVPQLFYAPDVKARRRAFCFKTSYMTYVLNNYIANEDYSFEAIEAPDNIPFEDYVTEEIGKYRGRTQEELAARFDISLSPKPKNLGSIIAFRILGVKSNNAEQFVKANIAVKTIRISKTGRIPEHMSFQPIKFKEFAEEEWEDSTFKEYLEQTRFLFVVYKEDCDGKYHLQGCQFWRIPNKDLEGNVKEVWMEAQKVVRSGVIVRSDGTNNFPKQANNPVSHVRPKARNAADTDELPNGQKYTKQCFWLNSGYILSQLDERLK